MKSPISSRLEKDASKDWSKLIDLLDVREYENVKSLINEAQKQASEKGDSTLFNLLTAAFQICSTCQDFVEVTTVYKDAYKTAMDREYNLRQQLISLLKTISENQPDYPSMTIVLAPEKPKGEVNEADIYHSHIAEKITELWQKIHNLFLIENKDSQKSNLIKKEVPHKNQPVNRKKPIVNKESSERWNSLPAKPIVASIRSPVQTENNNDWDDLNTPLLVVYCLGPFQVFLNNIPIEKWPSGKGKSIFKYLVNNRDRPIAKEVLMELFWPEADPDAARNNLNVAIYGLRQALRNGDADFSHVLYRNENYLLNPELQIWLDVEEFIARFQNGQKLQRQGLITEAVREYHTAEELYQGEFLEEDRYEEWLLPLRQQLSRKYLELLEILSQYYFDEQEYTTCIIICRSMLALDPCLEDTYCRLMCCYCYQGQRHLALRQYHHCVKALKEELEVVPGPEIGELYEKIRHYEKIYS